MGLDTEDVPYIALAESWGAGSAAIGEDDVISLNEPAEGETYPSPSGTVKQLTRGVRADSACSACYAALVRGLYLAREEGISVKGPISIGQGFKGKTLKGLGIGKCCAGAERCAAGCPPAAAEVLRFLREA